jgi:bifunctional polynucleotide phosphatase/kinase
MIKIININNAIYKSKMASFDYDWTLVCPNDDKIFPKNIDDWKLLFDTIIDKLNSYYNNEYMLVIFTNQSKEWKIKQIQNFCKSLNLPIFIVIAFKDKSIYKPNKKLFEAFIKDNYIDLNNSFYVGDALGRSGDWSNTDKLFANNIGIDCYAPEDIFYKQVLYSIPDIELSDNLETIIMVGYPGSGKTTIANSIKNKKENYSIISGDVCKTIPKIIKSMKELFKLNNNIIIDATNSSIKKRKNYIELSKNYNYNVKCIYVSTDMNESLKRNNLRKKPVPKIAYSVYKKYFEIPSIEEGFELIII